MKKIIRQASITNRDEILTSYFRDIRHIDPLTREDEIELSKRIKEGDDSACDKLVTANLRFVITVAKQYQHQGLGLSDLIQYGNEGLVKAAKHYDGTKGYKFISYAVWWIRQAIISAIYNASNTIRFSTSHLSRQYKIKRSISKLETQLERSPTIEEISQDIDMPVSQVNDIFLYDREIISADSSTGTEDLTIGDAIQGDSYSDTNIIKESNLEHVDRIISRLGGREQDVIRLLFGINVREQTLEEVGNKFGTTAERIRQIKENALVKLKNRYSDELKNLL